MSGRDSNENSYVCAFFVLRIENSKKSISIYRHASIYKIVNNEDCMLWEKYFGVRSRVTDKR